eukprot:4494407-Amphidinium_carterae.3
MSSSEVRRVEFASTLTGVGLTWRGSMSLAAPSDRLLGQGRDRVAKAISAEHQAKEARETKRRLKELTDELIAKPWKIAKAHSMVMGSGCDPDGASVPVSDDFAEYYQYLLKTPVTWLRGSLLTALREDLTQEAMIGLLKVDAEADQKLAMAMLLLDGHHPIGVRGKAEAVKLYIERFRSHNMPCRIDGASEEGRRNHRYETVKFAQKFECQLGRYATVIDGTWTCRENWSVKGAKFVDASGGFPIPACDFFKGDPQYATFVLPEYAMEEKRVDMLAIADGATTPAKTKSAGARKGRPSKQIVRKSTPDLLTGGLEAMMEQEGHMDVSPPEASNRDDDIAAAVNALLG